ncbi:MAG: efflux RND transporter permease subunit [Clostridium sp.]|nr:efflux RND transporter permease subunit [Clostridium sp.]
MNLIFFIKRPIFSAVISLMLVILGVIGLFSLPVEQFPDIAPPTVQVSTTYFGANAETIQKSVIAPLEEAINGVENMTYMTSSATNAGTMTITVYFSQGTDPDIAVVNVQNRVSKAMGSLPSEVTQVGVTTFKQQNSILQMFTLHSPDGSYDEAFLSNYIAINLKPEILRISGVGDMLIMGGDYSIRIWMKPDVMCRYNLVPADVTAALAIQNIEAATGSFGENSRETYQYSMRYKGRKMTPEEFGDIVILATEQGEVLRLRDIADIEQVRDSYAFCGAFNVKPGITCMVFQTSGSNATEVNEQIDKFLEKAEKEFPKGIELTQVHNTNDYLYASIHEVVKTLLEAILLVIIVVYVFLQDLRSTLIPLVGIIVSLIGTFAFMAIAGFSVNLITLFALVLVIGTVVDDSIVVVEAVQACFDQGYRSPYKASVDAIRGISNAVVTSSLVFMAVFVPVSFMSGTSGTFYRQFGLTMAVAVGLSAVNALSVFVLYGKTLQPIKRY